MQKLDSLDRFIQGLWFLGDRQGLLAPVFSGNILERMPMTVNSN